MFGKKEVRSWLDKDQVKVSQANRNKARGGQGGYLVNLDLVLDLDLCGFNKLKKKKSFKEEKETRGEGEFGECEIKKVPLADSLLAAPGNATA